jgi:hypothetical protein
VTSPAAFCGALLLLLQVHEAPMLPVVLNVLMFCLIGCQLCAHLCCCDGSLQLLGLSSLCLDQRLRLSLNMQEMNE